MKRFPFFAVAVTAVAMTATASAQGRGAGPSARMILAGSLTQSYSVKQDAVLDGMGVGRRHVDVSGSVALPLTSRTAAFVNVGRSLSPLEEGGTSLALSGGISFRFSTAATP